MRKASVRRRLYRERVIAILRERDARTCVSKARALHRGGLRAIEVTWTTPGAAGALARIARLRGVLAGAGSILDTAQAVAALRAGARFLVSPVYVDPVARLAGERDVLYIPGALTPREIAECRDRGARPVKVFPAGDLGGPAYVRHVLAPMPDLELCPTGGVNPENLAAYLEAGARLVGMGEILTRGGPADVLRVARRVRRIAAGRGNGMGVNDG